LQVGCCITSAAWGRLQQTGNRIGNEQDNQRKSAALLEG